MIVTNRRRLLISIGSMALMIGDVAAQATDCTSQSETTCASMVLRDIDAATTPDEAFAAWAPWIEYYEAAYRKFENAPVPPSDLDRFEGGIKEKIDQFTDPANIALTLAIARYFPKLATIMGVADSTVIASIILILAPSPLQTPIQQLKATNDDISNAVWKKIEPSLLPNWKQRYSDIIKESGDNTLGGRGKP